jgi:REP element-mobilizing transposase RayT
MARGPRLNIPDGIYHVMSRGNRKATIFEDDHDRDRFIEIVATAAAQYGVRIFAENRLGNHYHQVVQTPLANLPHYMGYINGGFAQFSNYRHQRIGHVFNERYKPVLIGDDYHLRIATGYVLFNPVKHGLVNKLGDWKSSSYRATAGLETPPDYLYLDWLISAFPSASLEDAQRRLCEYLETPEPCGAEQMHGPAFGSSAFERDVREHITATMFMAALPRSYRALGRPPLADLFPPGIPKVQRNQQMLRAQVLYGYRTSEIAAALYMNPSTISRVVADLRRKARNLGRF